MRRNEPAENESIVSRESQLNTARGINWPVYPAGSLNLFVVVVDLSSPWLVVRKSAKSREWEESAKTPLPRPNLANVGIGHSIIDPESAPKIRLLGLPPSTSLLNCNNSD